MEEEHSGALGVACSHATDTLEAVLGPIVSLSGYAETLHPDDHYADSGEPFRWDRQRHRELPGPDGKRRHRQRPHQQRHY